MIAVKLLLFVYFSYLLGIGVSSFRQTNNRCANGTRDCRTELCQTRAGIRTQPEGRFCARQRLNVRTEIELERAA
ncbi:hypothetical protein BKA57DRAFT_467323 [Linnemannia elongata]|nr:hypothetical protein BKA57DRAFT_467323 [Linnemannia elongata]